MMLRSLLIFSLFAVAALSLAGPRVGADAPPAERPYRLFYCPVLGSAPPASAFVLVLPDGQPVLATFDKLHWTIDRVVKAPATLRWEPTDVRVGPEPLDAPEARRALETFCKEHGITLVVVPAG